MSGFGNSNGELTEKKTTNINIIDTGVQQHNAQDIQTVSDVAASPVMTSSGTHVTNANATGSVEHAGTNEEMQFSAKDYFERILDSAKDKNLALKLRSEKEDGKDNWTSDELVRKVKFTQKLPTEVRDRWFGLSSETARIKDARRTFRKADLCTVREKDALDKLFRNDDYDRTPRIAHNMSETIDDDRVKLQSYVDYILNFKLTVDHLTDDYLSKHINEIFEYSWNLEQYNALKSIYPGFFHSLSEVKKIELEQRLSNADALMNLVKEHLKVHGIEIKKGDIEKNEKDKAVLRNEQLTDKEAADYKKHVREFTLYAFDGIDIRLALRFSKIDAGKEIEEQITFLKEQFGKGSKAGQLFGNYAQKAINEIEKTLKVKAGLIGEQKENIKKLNTKEKKFGSKTDREIRRNNEKILLCAQHIDNYKEYLDFLNGDIDNVSSETIDFLIRDKNESLLEPVKFQIRLQCIEDGLAICKSKGGKAVKAERIVKDKFFNKYNAFLKDQKKAKEFNDAMKKWNERLEKAKERAGKYAEEKKMKEVHTRFALNLVDPFSEWIGEEELFYACVAGFYKPTGETPEEAVKEICDKGIMPMFNKVLKSDHGIFKECEIGNNVDFNKEGYWKKRAMIKFGFDMDGCLRILKNYELDISDENYKKLKSYGFVMQSIHSAQRLAEEKMAFPHFNQLASNKEVIANLTELKNLTNDTVRKSKKERTFFDNYSEKKLGFSLKEEEPGIASRHIGRSVIDYTDTMLNHIIVLRSENLGANPDYEKEYSNAEKELVKDKYSELTESKLALELDEMKKQGIAGDEKIALERIRIKDCKAMVKNYPIPYDFEGKDTLGKTMRYVECDANGTVKKKYRDEYKKNLRDIEDYIEGGEKRKDYLRRRISEIISLVNTKLNEKTLTPQYLDDHFIEFYNMSQIFKGFRQIAMDNEAYIESDAFTLDERISFRSGFLENPLVSKLETLMELATSSMGITIDGKEIDRSESVIDKTTLPEFQERIRDQNRDLMNELLKDVPEDIKSAEEFDKALRKDADRIGKITAFEAELNSRIRTRNKDAAAKGVNIWKSYSPLVKEIREYFYGSKKVISNEALVFAADNNFGEYFKQEDIDNAAFRIEKTKLLNAYGFDPKSIDDASDKAVKDRNEIKKLLGVAEDTDIVKAIEDRARIGVKIQRSYSLYNKNYTDEQLKRFESEGNVGKDDARCFLRLQTPVKYDIFGKVLSGYEDNEETNAERIDDYLSKDQERQKSVLRKMADLVLEINLNDEMINEDYFKEHLEEVIEVFSTLHRFENYFLNRQDFFMSNAFTDDEKQKLLYLYGSKAAQSARVFFDSFISAYGYDSANGKLNEINGSKKESDVRVFRGNITTKQLDMEYYKDSYAKARRIEEENKDVTELRNKQIQKLAERRGAAQRRGEDVRIYIPIFKVANNLSRGIDSSRDKIKELVGYKEVEAESEERNVELDDINFAAMRSNYSKTNPWKTRTETENATKMGMLVNYNNDRVNASDKLCREIMKCVSEGKSLDTPSLKRLMRAYTDRLLELKPGKKKIDEDYIINNIDLLLEQIRAYSVLSIIEQHCPDIFADLSISEQVSIRERKKYAIKANKAVEAIMAKYGLVLKCSRCYDTEWGAVYENLELDGNRKSKKPSKEKVLQSERYVNEAIADLNETDNIEWSGRGKAKWLIKAVKEIETKEGKSVKSNPHVRKLYDLEAIEDKLKKNKELYVSCSPYYDRIMKQYREDVRSAEDKLSEFSSLNNEYQGIRFDYEELIRKKSAGNEKNFKSVEEAVRKAESSLIKVGNEAFMLHTDLEKYHELFDLVSGNGTILSKGAEALLEKKELSTDYGMILTNIVLNKTGDIEEKPVQNEGEKVLIDVPEADNGQLQKAVEKEPATDNLQTQETAAKVSVTQGEHIQETAGEGLVTESKEETEEKEQKPLTESLHLQANAQEQELRAGEQENVNANKTEEKYDTYTNLSTEFEYEIQTTNNCWCVCGSAMYNQFIALNSDAKEKQTFYNQKDFRNYVPAKIKTLEDIRNAGFNEYSEYVYDKSKADMESYAGEGKENMGSIFEMADFFLEKRKDVVVNRLVIHTPHKENKETKESIQRDNEKLEAQKKIFFDEVKKVIDTGNVVSINKSYELGYGHYMTITGVKGNKVKYLNPANGREELEDDIGNFLYRNTNQSDGHIELTWLSKLSDPDELLKAYKSKGLKFDKKNKTFSAPLIMTGAQNIGQTLGVLVEEEDMVASVARQVYIPKNYD
ncbi:MAG: hypothetical protein K6E91_13825 [Butyrivibrio sp.]|nr:hypothetical protein [Butyrivibrio sp.]